MTCAAGYAGLALALGANDPAAALTALSAVSGDPAFADMLRRHQLTSLLWATVREDALRARMPAAAFAALGEWLAARRRSPADDLHIFTEVRAALREAAVDCLLLKGAYFADRLYSSLERRAQYDTDLLVRRRDFRRALRVLAALGYLERWRDLHSATWQRGAAQIDVHTRFRNAPIYRLDEARIWRERIAYTVAGVSFDTTSDEDTLVLLAVSLFQDVGLGAAKLRQLLDVYLLAATIDEYFDWSRFFAARRPEGTLAIAVNVLDLVVHVFAASATLPRLATALARHADVLVVTGGEEARALVVSERSAAANRAWFFAVYPGSITRYWLWLLPRKFAMYLAGKAPGRAPSSMRLTLATVRLFVGAQRGRRLAR